MAVAASFKDSAKIGALAGARQAQRLLGASPYSETATPIDDTGDKSWLRFPLDQVVSIECRRDKFGFRSHKLIISTVDRKQVTFGLFIRADFELIASTLRLMFGDRVIEK